MTPSLKPELAIRLARTWQPVRDLLEFRRGNRPGLDEFYVRSEDRQMGAVFASAFKQNSVLNMRFGWTQQIQEESTWRVVNYRLRADGQWSASMRGNVRP